MVSLHLNKISIINVNSFVLDFYCCCNKLPRTEQFKITKMYSLIVLEVKCPESVSLAKTKVWSAGLVLFGGQGKICVLDFLNFQWPTVFLGLWPPVFLHLQRASLNFRFVIISPSPLTLALPHSSYKDCCDHIVRGHLAHGIIHNNLPLSRPLIHSHL